MSTVLVNKVRVRLLNVAAGPDFGPHDPGTILEVPAAMAHQWFRARQAVPVDFALPDDYFDAPEVDPATERAVSTTHPETTDAMRRGPGRPRGS